MKKLRKICFFPVYGPIIFFFIIAFKLKIIDKFSARKTFAYLLVMMIFGVIGMLMTGLCLIIFNLNIGLNIYSLIFICVFVWPLMTVPVLEYSKKAEIIFDAQCKDKKTNS